MHVLFVACQEFFKSSPAQLPMFPAESDEEEPQSCCQCISNAKVFKAITLGTLLVALFAWSVVNIADLPDDPTNFILDIVMMTGLVIFVLEVIICSLADPMVYPLSFFFWMDVAGTVSMIFEITFILGKEGEITEVGESVNTLVLRAARTSKFASRAGRFLKVVKFVSLVFRRTQREEEAETAQEETKKLSQSLSSALSAKVALLTILLVLFLPLFTIGQYPEEDMSLRAWAQRLEEDYKRSYDILVANPSLNKTDVFEDVVKKMIAFFDDVDYFPFYMHGFTEELSINARSVTIPGEALLADRHEPKRKRSLYRQKVEECSLPRAACAAGGKSYIDYDFAVPRRLEATMDIATVCTIIFLMCAMSLDFNRTVNNMVVNPLERMLGKMRVLTSKIMDQVSQMDTYAQDKAKNKRSSAVKRASSRNSGVVGEAIGWTGSLRSDTKKKSLLETDRLEYVVEKLTKLATLYTDQNVLKETELNDMSTESRGVVLQMLEAHVPKTRKQIRHQTMQNLDEAKVDPLPCSQDAVESFWLDILDIKTPQIRSVLNFIFFDSYLASCAGRRFSNRQVFNSFHDVIKSGYHENPYHCYQHACDVTHTVFRMLCETQAKNWVSKVEVYALLISALCHDLSHPGVTNQYIIEIQHELAIIHNDRSPLENMHCSKLFEICAGENTNIFSQLDAEAYKNARKVCITCILHTDNAVHFDMVKDIGKVFEMSEEICDRYAEDPAESWENFEEQVLRKNVSSFLELFLHLADVSNPLKHFSVCQAWAWRVLDEFFAQGDQEKKMGIPVGMLNDRDKINRPGSQHSFIIFLVSPLVTVAVKLFHPFYPLACQMASNLEDWRDMWIQDVRPPEEEIQKKNEAITKQKELTESLRLRNKDAPKHEPSRWNGRKRYYNAVSIEDLVCQV